MKGLLVKDFRLMKGQKNFYFIIAAIAIGIAAISDDSSFLLGLPLVLSLFTLNTISYDEFDNGNAFLFTLPVSRADYVIEKYCFAFLIGCSAWIFTIFLALVLGLLSVKADVSETMVTAMAVLPAVIVIQAIMIPFQLKFGAEKGRIALLGALGALFMISIVLVKAAKMLKIDTANFVNHLPMISKSTATAMVLVILVIILLLSLKASISIMKHKEF